MIEYFFRNIHGRWFMFICVYFCAQRRWLLDETLYIKMLPQRLPILGFFNIAYNANKVPNSMKKCKDTIQQVSFPTTRVMRRTCLISNRLSVSHSAWDRDSSDNLTFLVCPVTSKGRDHLKKNVFFRALPELPKPPPPHDPNSGNLVLFFRKSKFKIWKSV